MLSRVMSLGMSGEDHQDQQRAQAMQHERKVDGIHVPIDMRLSIGGNSTTFDADPHAPGGRNLRASGYSEDFYRHNEALRKRTQANHGAVPKPELAGGGDGQVNAPQGGGVGVSKWWARKTTITPRPLHGADPR